MKQILRDAFGPMPTVRTVVARFELLGIIVFGWVALAGLSLGIDVLRAAIQNHK